MTIRVAHVGAFDRLSQDDENRDLSVMGLIALLDPDYLKDQDLAPDIINLTYGRDFLEESKSYDIVILHSIVSTKVRLPSSRFPRLRASPSHGLKVWRVRLGLTGAKYIAICEGLEATLSGHEMGEILGYNLLKEDNFVTLYRRM